MKTFFLVLLFLTGFFFSASVVSVSASPPPDQLTVSLGQQQLDQVATIYTMAEQNVTFTYQTVSYAYQVRTATIENHVPSNLPLPPYLYSTFVENGNTTLKFQSDRLCLRQCTSINLNLQDFSFVNNSSSMRLQARNAVLNQIGFVNSNYNLNALIRML